ncbi:MAG: long-chain acyl-CoA synthetase, partial [Myxococcota bacterium]
MYAELEQTWNTLISAGERFEIVETVVRGHSLREYKNAPPTLRHVWQIAEGHGAKDYLVYQDERWTFDDAHREVASIARWLFDAGVEPGDRVAIAMRNYPEWMLAYWACTSVGVAAVGMNAWWTGPEMAYGIEDSNPKVIIADRERLERLAEYRDVMKGKILVGVRSPDGLLGATPWSELVKGAGPLPDVTVDPDDDACIFYTSGTTGKPKGAQLTHRGCVNNLMSLAFSAAVHSTAVAAAKAKDSRAAAPVPVPVASPVALVTTPLFHVTANNCLAHSMTLAGGTLVHMYKWEAGEALRLIEAEKVTTMSGVPVMARELISHPDFETRDTSTLQTLGGGGAQVQPDLVKKIDQSRGSARPSTGYGMTETCGIITGVSADFFVDRPESCGRAMPTFATKVIDAEGNEVARGEVGEL